MIIITGASGGIGSFLMNEFIKNNVEVRGIYNSTKPSLNRELMYKADITDTNEISKFIEEIGVDLKNVILINCAGSNYNAFAHKADPVIWASLIQINLIGTFNMINALLPTMRSQNYGRIINIASVVAQKGVAGTSAYAASKSGLWGMTKAIAAENSSKGITINNLNLGYFHIGMIDDIPESLQEQIKSTIPTRDFGNPKDILNSINYLIETHYITGTSIDVNGGLV
ncbi:SDR family NAD(P)-dependent oxidoreductase [Flavobacteriales bacterium]|nr:SDR family NAD(P)-dependent oxidoreductase [Flavobacteriales bacterium]